MSLSIETAARKDRRAGLCEMQHRHFAAIAAIIKNLHGGLSVPVADHFANRLAATNPRFDRARFLKACGA